jgi:hypothetical protein
MVKRTEKKKSLVFYIIFDLFKSKLLFNGLKIDSYLMNIFKFPFTNASLLIFKK